MIAIKFTLGLVIFLGACQPVPPPYVPPSVVNTSPFLTRGDDVLTPPRWTEFCQRQPQECRP